MATRFLRCAHFLGMVGGFVILLPACSKNPQESAGPKMVWGQTVRGTVTYNGEPVVYGYVMFYSPDKSVDPKSGRVAAVAVADINNGKYEMINAPTGPVMVCIAADPDIDPATLLKPAIPGFPRADSPGSPGAPPGGPPGAGGPGVPPAPPGAVPPGMPPMRKNPLTEKLTDAQKATLREIHRKYGAFGMNPLAHDVREGEQTFDIVLKK